MTEAHMTYGDWTLAQRGFDQRFLGKTEAIMTQGNGYLGIRAAEDERYTGEIRDTFVAGTFNAFDENEVTELPNMPDFLGLDFALNGERFTLAKGDVSDYIKELNLQNGVLTRSFTWTYKAIKLGVVFRRFVAKNDRHFLASQVNLTNLAAEPLHVSAKTGINGQTTNSGSQHFTDGVKGLVENKYLQMAPQTTHSKIDVVLTLETTVANANILKARAEMDRRAIFMNHDFDIPAGESVALERRATIYTSIDNDIANRSLTNLQKIAIDALKSKEAASFDDLIQESQEAWDAVWNVHPITITSQNAEDQLAIRFATYHLHTMTPSHDNRMNIGAKGLSGEGYKGHTFWDTEIFMLPYFIFTHPEIAKSLVTYRYLGLDGAHKKAASNHYQGAQYPWEAAWPTEGEVTPVWGAVDIVTGQSMKIWSGFIEQHITSDVAFGIKQYIDVTGDSEFAREKGYEILLDTAKFWLSRLEYNSELGLYEINDVIGADEYKEHINNNAYTNYTASWNIDYAIYLIKNLMNTRSETYYALDAKFNLKVLLEELEEKLPRIFLPQPTIDGVIPQDDSYLSKKIIDISKYKTADGVDGLFHDYNLEQVNAMQITKQADVLLLLLLFEGLFDKELKLKNFEYYEPKTTHDSSLSLSTHAILSADLGKMDQAYDFFTRAKSIDMGAYMKSSDAGIHAASLGGIWQMTVLGFGGVRMIDGKLRIEPHLPEAWERLEFGFTYQGEDISVTVSHDFVSVDKENNGNDVAFLHKGKSYILQHTLQLSLKEGNS
ncbi:MAG: glycoside hydrolase family 65 protein [Streptococcaceae bacterium]|nr:glycoside hydrolase family 65 protein [Streptococcaceae bacterium]